MFIKMNHAQELVIINKDPTKFTYYKNDFSKRSKSIESRSYKSQMRKILNEDIKMTDAFVELVKNKFGPTSDEYQKALSLPKIDPVEFRSNLSGPALNNFVELDSELLLPQNKTAQNKTPQNKTAQNNEEEELNSLINTGSKYKEALVKARIESVKKQNKELEQALIEEKEMLLREAIKVEQTETHYDPKKSPLMSKKSGGSGGSDIEVSSDTQGLPTRLETPKTVLKEVEVQKNLLADFDDDTGRSSTFQTSQDVINSPIINDGTSVLSDPSFMSPIVPVPQAQQQLPPTQQAPPAQTIDPVQPSYTVDKPKEQHPVRYHTNSILYFFGSLNEPEWDRELEANVFSAKLSKEEIIESIDSIIINYGSVIFAFQRKSETIEEFHELIQLQFCVLRNLARGTRTKMAMVPISSLVNFQNKLNGGNNAPLPPPDQRNDNVGDFPEGAPPHETDNPPVVQALNAPVSTPAIQVQVSKKEAFDNIVKAYNNREYDSYGKPIYSDKVDMFTRRNHNILGNMSIRNPTGNVIYANGFFKKKR